MNDAMKELVAANEDAYALLGFFTGLFLGLAQGLDRGGLNWWKVAKVHRRDLEA